MASDTLKTIVVGLALFVLFAWFAITIAVDFGSEYGKTSDNIGNGSLNLVDFQNSANNISTSTASYRQSFESGAVDDIDDASGMWATAKKFVNLITSPFKLLAQIMENIFKIPEIFVNTILGVLGISIILAIWSVLRKGD